MIVLLDALGIRTSTIEECERFSTVRDAMVNEAERTVNENIEKAKPIIPNLCSANFITFGDTLVIEWEILEGDDLAAYILSLGSWVSSFVIAGLKNKILWRGAMSCGEYIWSNSSILGPAVADAASWYEMADWFGVVATPACGHTISLISETFRCRFKDSNSPISGLSFVEYKVPMKDGREIDLWSVGWPGALLLTQAEGRKKLFELLKAFHVPPGTESKYHNSIKYFDWYDINIKQHIDKCLSVSLKKPLKLETDSPK